jgi:hypothetical protein
MQPKFALVKESQFGGSTIHHTSFHHYLIHSSAIPTMLLSSKAFVSQGSAYPFITFPN